MFTASTPRLHQAEYSVSPVAPVMTGPPVRWLAVQPRRSWSAASRWLITDAANTGPESGAARTASTIGRGGSRESSRTTGGSGVVSAAVARAVPRPRSAANYPERRRAFRNLIQTRTRGFSGNVSCRGLVRFAAFRSWPSSQGSPTAWHRARPTGQAPSGHRRCAWEPTRRGGEPQNKDYRVPLIGWQWVGGGADSI